VSNKTERCHIQVVFPAYLQVQERDLHGLGIPRAAHNTTFVAVCTTISQYQDKMRGHAGEYGTKANLAWTLAKDRNACTRMKMIVFRKYDNALLSTRLLQSCSR